MSSRRRRSSVPELNVYSLPFKASPEVEKILNELKEKDVNTYFKLINNARILEITANTYCRNISAMLFKENFGLKQFLTNEDRTWLDTKKEACRQHIFARSRPFLEEIILSLPKCIQQCAALHGNGGYKAFRCRRRCKLSYEVYRLNVSHYFMECILGAVGRRRTFHRSCCRY
eukprot:TRINITY_DN616_c0_g2_i1.p1 TRINITY_DN616_c0_g2~~TRINITY_DN616_c0_g2_i1.p1  ORF type:complete len:173 (-),score=38.64 TRINITY_DN616_c0_g2_i1:135-653(-)